MLLNLKKGKRNIAIIKIRIREKIKGESSWLRPIFPTGYELPNKNITKSVIRR